MASDICAYGTECSESLAVVTTLLATLLTKFVPKCLLQTIELHMVDYISLCSLSQCATVVEYG